MKKYFTYIGVAILMMASSCNILDKEPYDSVPEEEVWGNVGLANLYLNNLYNLTLPTFGATNTSSRSDETGGENDYIYGKLDQESVGDFSSDTYAKIRKINMLLERIDHGGIKDQNAINQIKGQAYFLRAWVYWNLVNLYGGVPMVMHTQSLNTNGEPSAEIKVERSKTGACIDTIVHDLDLAARYLPKSWADNDYGRVTRGAAMALKGRILLFWASPQFNQFNNTDRWERAYIANKNAKDTLTADNYGLHSATGSTNGFAELFNDCREKTKEAIFVRVYDANIAGSYYHAYDNSVRPRAQGISGGTTNNPSWELVGAFPMSNGYPIYHPLSNYDTTVYFLNRDPRFYATVAYNTSTWPLSGLEGYKIWTYYYDATNSTEGSAHTSTGFYCKKYVNPSIKAANVLQIGTDWMEIRFAEVLLNLAECANELATRDAQLAYDCVRDVRKRAWPTGAVEANFMGNITTGMTVGEMREVILRERQVELAFENKRYWDLRRRNMFVTDLGVNTKALNGTVRNAWREQLETGTISETAFKEIRDTKPFNTARQYNSYFKAPFKESLDTKQTINHPQPKYNFFAIPKDNLDKNTNLKQTTYWGGSFDPMAE